MFSHKNKIWRFVFATVCIGGSLTPVQGMAEAPSGVSIQPASPLIIRNPYVKQPTVGEAGVHAPNPLPSTNSLPNSNPTQNIAPHAPRTGSRQAPPPTMPTGLIFNRHLNWVPPVILPVANPANLSSNQLSGIQRLGEIDAPSHFDATNKPFVLKLPTVVDPFELTAPNPNGSVIAKPQTEVLQQPANLLAGNQEPAGVEPPVPFRSIPQVGATESNTALAHPPSILPESDIHIAAVDAAVYDAPTRGLPLRKSLEVALASASRPVEGPPFHVWLAEGEKRFQLVASGKAESVEQEVTWLTATANVCRQVLKNNPPEQIEKETKSLGAKALNMRGEISVGRGEHQAAWNDFRQAIQWNPACHEAIQNCAITWAENGRLERALEAFDRVLQIDPGNQTALRNRGQLHISMGETSAAVADFTSVIEQFKAKPVGGVTTSEIYLQRANAFRLAGLWKFALQDLSQAVQANSQSTQALLQRGNLHAELGQYKNAVSDYIAALKVDPHFGAGYRELAWVWATCPDTKVQNAKKALSAAELASQYLGPADPLVLDTQAAALAASKQFKEAARLAKRAASLATGVLKEQVAQREALYRKGLPFRSHPHLATLGINE